MGWLGSVAKVYTIIKALASSAVLLMNAFVAYQKEQRLKKKLEELKKVQDQNEAANEIEDDTERLKAKAKAAHDLENIVSGN